MAVASRPYLIFNNGVRQKLDSNVTEILFQSVSVTNDGVDNGFTITQANATDFDFNAKNFANVGTINSVDIAAHAARHISGGADEIDGDQLDIDWSPANYTPSTAPTEVTLAQHLTAHLAGIDSALATAGVDEQVKVSANDTTEKFLEDAVVASAGVNPTNALEITTLNDGANESLQFQFDESKINHDNLTGFVANEHIDHSSVSIVAGGDDGLLVANDDLTANLGLAIDIAGSTAETAVADGDELLIQDISAGALRKMTRADFIGSASILMESGFDITMAGGGELLGLPTTPTAANAAVSKAYVDAVRVAARVIQDIDVASTADVGGSYAAGTITGLGASLSIDSYAVQSGDRVLLKNQSNAQQNGVYVYDGVDELSRSLDMDNSPAGEVYNGVLTARVQNGSIGGGNHYVITSVGTGVDGLHTLDTDDVIWSLWQSPTQLSAGDGIDSTLFATNTVQLDLAASGGLKFSSSQLAVEPDDFAGDGLEDDGADSLRVQANVTETSATLASAIDVASAGVSIRVDNDTLEGSGQGAAGAEDLQVKHTRALANNSGSPIAANDIVYINASGEILGALATNASSHDFAVGVAAEAIANGASGLVFVRLGAIVSGFSGMTPGRKQYVDRTTAGAITETAPSTSGDHVVAAGRAISATELLYMPEHEVEIL